MQLAAGRQRLAFLCAAVDGALRSASASRRSLWSCWTNGEDILPFRCALTPCLGSQRGVLDRKHARLPLRMSLVMDGYGLPGIRFSRAEDDS